MPIAKHDTDFLTMFLPLMQIQIMCVCIYNLISKYIRY